MTSLRREIVGTIASERAKGSSPSIQTPNPNPPTFYSLQQSQQQNSQLQLLFDTDLTTTQTTLNFSPSPHQDAVHCLPPSQYVLRLSSSLFLTSA
jgi:hypothetical protein